MFFYVNDYNENRFDLFRFRKVLLHFNVLNILKRNRIFFYKFKKFD